MLRKALLFCGIVMLLGGAVITVVGRCRIALEPTVFGAILLLALLFERHRYKRIVDDVPGPDWQATGERFLDPNSEVLVEVYFQPATGKRAYVRTLPSA